MKKFSLILILCMLLTLAVGCDEDDDLLRRGTRESSGIDYDLTSYTSQIATATMTDMFENPDKYVGKVVKVRGTYFPVFVEEVDRDVHYLQVDDESGCCVQYFEFKQSSDDFPDEEAKIELIGTFGLYDDGEYTEMVYLAVKDLIILT
ncbi:MAG: hypothetical protein FWG33_03000 [Oscillospiraceae bacterium]|nr:hypothetical protein [Oscillospiraceae bacterium]